MPTEIAIARAAPFLRQLTGQRRIMSTHRAGAMIARPLLTDDGDARGVLVAVTPAAARTRNARHHRRSPHFIYNALNTIASFVRTDPVRALEFAGSQDDAALNDAGHPGFGV